MALHGTTGQRRTAPSLATIAPGRRGDYDTEQRALAAGLDQSERGWHVFYGVGSRRFWAFAAWPARRPLVVESPNVHELRHEMRVAESGDWFAALGGQDEGGLAR